MDRSLPHFLRFTRALALVSGTALAVSACGGAVESEPTTNNPDAAYDGHVTGTPPIPYDGSVTGITDATVPGIDAGIVGYPYDGGPVGTPVYDGGPVGIPPPPFDGGPTGTPVYDAGVADAEASDAFMGGGPLDPPDFPA